MRKLKTSDWLLTLAAAVGLASSASAQDAKMVQRADAILGGPQQSLIQQISGECAPAPCAPGCDISCDTTGMGCDSIDCDSCYLFDCDFSLQNLIDPCGESAFSVGGWYQLGYHNKSTGLFNSRPGEFATHQAWLFAEKAADGSEGLDWGFRMDLMYGLDADDTQSFGNNSGEWDFENGWDHGSYGWAMPQLYVELAAGDLSVIAGHFYTLLGYEVVTAPDNFFYSHAFTMYNSEAFTHTGVLATYALSDNVEVYGGWTLGWDTGFDQNNDGSSFLGGLSVGVTDNLSATFITTFGNFGANGDGYSHSLVLDWAVTDKLNYVFQTDFVDTNSDVFDDGGTTYHTVGINQYLLYSINDCLGAGLRAEWWKVNGTDVGAATIGLNYRPSQNLVIRPEVRWQSAEDDGVIESDGDTIFGIDAILTF